MGCRTVFGALNFPVFVEKLSCVFFWVRDVAFFVTFYVLFSVCGAEFVALRVSYHVVS